MSQLFARHYPLLTLPDYASLKPTAKIPNPATEWVPCEAFVSVVSSKNFFLKVLRPGRDGERRKIPIIFEGEIQTRFCFIREFSASSKAKAKMIMGGVWLSEKDFWEAVKTQSEAYRAFEIIKKEGY